MRRAALDAAQRGGLPERQGSRPPTLSDDVAAAGVKVDVVDLEFGDLGQSAAGVDEESDDGVVPARDEVVAPAALDPCAIEKGSALEAEGPVF